MGRHGPALAMALALLAGTPVASAAQQPAGSGIETKPLEPLAPAPGDGAGNGGETGVVPRDNRFMPAPFRTLGTARAPELIDPVATSVRPGARLRGLDKMTGRTTTVDIAAGGEEMVDRLRVRLEACRAPDDNAQHGTMAFVEIWDTKQDAPDPVFSGWMFAESPALSAMDHPRYDLWVISCTTSDGGAPAASE